MFMSDDGVRLLSQDGTLAEPNPDLKLPFIHALTPSRASGCYNNNVYRISVQNGNANDNPIEEYWYDFRVSGWTGPHTFVQNLAVPYLGTFVAFSNTLSPGLWVSDVVQSGTSVFTENGVAMTFLERTVPMPDGETLYANSVVLSVADLVLPHVAQSYTFVAIDTNNGVLSQATLATTASGAIWDGFNWGAELWTATSYGLERYNIPWTEPLVFSRLVVQMTGLSTPGLKIGKLTTGYQPLKYVRIK
jgi:hypothetical protein